MSILLKVFGIRTDLILYSTVCLSVLVRLFFARCTFFSLLPSSFRSSRRSTGLHEQRMVGKGSRSHVAQPSTQRERRPLGRHRSAAGNDRCSKLWDARSHFLRLTVIPSQLIGTISEKMYPNKDITRAILKSGHWEGFLRSLALELQFMRRSCQHLLCKSILAATSGSSITHAEAALLTLPMVNSSWRRRGYPSTDRVRLHSTLRLQHLSPSSTRACQASCEG